MGLAGRKFKQRIGPDPRNTTWADDASRFGQAYLEKFGWSSGSGLGAEGDGIKTHIKASKKLDLLGIGAGRKQADDEGGQTRDYERLLKRLNASAVSSPPVVNEEDKGSDTEQVTATQEVQTETPVEKIGKKKKRKPKEMEEAAPAVEDLPPAPVPPAEDTKLFAPRPMAHRAKFLKSKKMASASNVSLSELLGISSSAASSSASTPLSSTPIPSVPASLCPSESTSRLTSLAPSPAPESDTPLSTSTKSVADYFAEKLAARKKSLASAVNVNSPLSIPLQGDCPDDTPIAGDKEEESSSATEAAISPPVPEEESADEGDDDSRKRRKKAKKDGEKKEKRKRRRESEIPVDLTAGNETAENDTTERKKSKKKRRKQEDS